VQRRLAPLIRAPQLERESKKMLKEEAQAQKKVADFIKKGDAASARIFAENAIRAKNQSLSYLRLSARIAAVASRVETALRMKQLTQAMMSVTKGMDTVLSSMDASKISKMMDKFEEQFETLDVRAAFMEGAMDSATATAAPASEVDALIGQIADKESLELRGELADIPRAVPSVTVPSATGPVAVPEGMPPPPSSGGPGSGGAPPPPPSGGGGGGGGGGTSVADALQARLNALRG
jgi:charged multivesicular body protein 1